MPLQYIFVSTSYQKQDIDYTVEKFYYVAKRFAQACCIEVQILFQHWLLRIITGQQFAYHE